MASRLDWLPWRRLRARGIMGMNERNGDFILRYNPRKHFPLVDDKQKTKSLALAAGIPVPDLYTVVEIEHQLAELKNILKPYEDFVVKPSHGSGGEGILVIMGRANDAYRKVSGTLVSDEDLEHHISNILSGMYSLGGLPDCALIEHRVKFDPIFSEVSYLGVPDIRTVVFRGIPVMAMVRLPTRASDGKANLHQGAIGAGIDLTTGRTLAGVWHESLVTQHPDTGADIEGLWIPQWDAILALTARCYDLVGMGYLGVDIVLDRELGPLMLEMNARPGLSIQLANRQGLLNRLRQVETLQQVPYSIENRVALAKELCVADESISG